MIEVTVRVYGALNDFWPVHRRQTPWRRVVDTHQSVKDVIESLVRNDDRIAVFPHFVSLDVRTLTHVRPPPLAHARFVADVHLGKLARRLRLAGLDTAYRSDADDVTLADLAHREERILLTRDQNLLKRHVVTHGYFVRDTDPHRQFVEVLKRFGPLDLRPFSICLTCDGLLRDVPKSAVDAALLPRTRQYYDCFAQCLGCGRVYWKGIALDAAETRHGRRA